jgi:hypothetical protein
MALVSECMQSCARIALDTADIVRDRDVTTLNRRSSEAACNDHAAEEVRRSEHTHITKRPDGKIDLLLKAPGSSCAAMKRSVGQREAGPGMGSF